MEEHFLRGSCTCGRNRYTVALPSDRSSSETTVFLDNSSASRRIHASPLIAFLRVPLSWLRSTTYAFYPDEDHNSIRRTYTTPLIPGTRKQFCGYCGTQLSSWSESGGSNPEFICLTLGSLLDEDLSILDQLGVLPGTEEDDEDGTGDLAARDAESRVTSREERDGELQTTTREVSSPSKRHIWTRGSPWFEEMVDNSGLTKLRKQRGGHVSEDGRTRVEYEIIEVSQGDTENDTLTRGKRKLEEDSSDYVMTGALAD